MDAAASTLAFTHLPLAGALAALRALGFASAELPLRGDGVWPGHVDPRRLADDGGYARELAASVAASGLALVSAGCEMAKDLPLDEELRRHRALAPWLAGLGAATLTIFAYAHDHPVRWRELDAIARAHGLLLAVETHLGTATATPAAAIRLVEERDMRLNLDASHYISQGFVPADWAPLLARVVAVQVRHCRPGYLQEPPADAAAIAARLPDLIPPGFTGPLVCEQISTPQDPDWSRALGLTRAVLAAGGHRRHRPG